MSKKNKNILSIVLGILLILFAVFLRFFESGEKIAEQAISIFIGLIIIWFVIVFVFPNYKKFPKLKGFIIAEISVDIIIAVVVALKLSTAINVNTSIGLVLYLRGLNYFYITSVKALSSKKTDYVLNILFLSLGVYVLVDKPIVNKNIEWALFVLLAGLGLFFIIKALMDLNKNKKHKNLNEIA